MTQPAQSSAWEDVIDTYCVAWDEPDPIRRDAMLRPVWADNGTYTDPSVHAVGRRELVDHIGRVLLRYPQSTIVRTSALDAHHEYVRFAWKKVLADGTSLPEGIDFGEIGTDGKLRRIVGFFGPLIVQTGAAA